MRATVVVFGLAVAAVFVVAGFALHAHEKREPIAASSSSSSQSTSSTRCEEPSRPATIRRPDWYVKRRATVLVDSVLLGGMDAVRRTLPLWKIAQVGHPAVMIRILNEDLRESGRRVAPLVIVGIGYNSLWERDRRNYRIWASEFDRQAKALLATLKRAGAEQFVWVTLRHARRAVIPESALGQFDQYAWYFPYVNERLKRLDGLRGDLALANWAAVSNKPGLTYDAIHLNLKGAALMGRTIKSAIEEAAKAEAVVTSHPKPGC